MVRKLQCFMMLSVVFIFWGGVSFVQADIESLIQEPEVVFYSHSNPVNSINDDQLVSSYKPVISSSDENSSYPASNVNDNDLSSRWGSQEGNDPEWIYIDLEESISISRVVLEWEESYATEYQIQVSSDALNWTRVYSETSGNGDQDDISINAKGRYVRVYGSQRATDWGYSLYEFKVYGTGVDSDPLLSVDKSAKSSSNENPSYPATNVNDNDLSSRWASQEGNDPEWIYIDLEESVSISRVVLEWEDAYAIEYHIEVSSDASNWTRVYSETSGKGDQDDISINAKGRYVRMHGTQRATIWGYSLYEFKIFGTIQGPVASQIILTSSSSALETGGEKTTMTASLLDVSGHFVNSAGNTVDFSLNGPGSLEGPNPIKAVNGRASITLQSDFQTGSAEVTASSINLSSGAVSVLIEEEISNEDLRVYQHGVDFVPTSNGNYQLIWASSGNPPTGPDNDGSWTHDIYYSTINPSNPPGSPQDNVVTIISRDEAQEPASSDVTNDGHIMITLEDGYEAPNWVAQRYGVYGEKFTNNPTPYNDVNTSVYEGGHSGHVAAAGNTFIVFWSDDWHGPEDNPPGPPGADGIGVGRHVLVDTYTSAGTHLNRKNVAVGDSTYDWWPVVAASGDKACLVWQRYVDGDEYSRLMYAIYNPDDNTFIKKVTEIQNYTRYYTYDVQYYPGIDRFLIAGTYYNGGGYVHLIDTEGNIVDSLTSLPTGIRESQPSVKTRSGEVLVVYPKSPNGLISFKLTKQSVSIHEQINHSYNWQYIGNDGIFIDNDTIYVAALSSSGMHTFIIDVTPLR